MSSPQLQRRHQTAGLEHPVSQDPSSHLQIPNPVICLVEGDMILFQLLILPYSEFCPSHPTSRLGSHPSLAQLSSEVTQTMPSEQPVPGLCHPPGFHLRGHFTVGLNFTSRNSSNIL